MAIEVRADMSASVWRVEVVPGQQVEVDDVLAVLESMKMEIPIVAETAGAVREVLVAEGDLVEEGTVVVTIDAPGG
jgi:acetyl-CoA carboxylase biotin carboxyl carrier protein